MKSIQQHDYQVIPYPKYRRWGALAKSRWSWTDTPSSGSI
jgi:hypothetical protein